MRARTRERRLGAAAVAGLAAALATAPLAHADDGAGTTAAPTTAPVTPGSDAATSPGSGVPSSPTSTAPSTPTSGDPTSTDPSSPTTGPSVPTSTPSGTPTSTAPSSPSSPTSSAPSSPTSSAPTSPSAPRTTTTPPAHRKLAAHFGTGKNRQIFVNVAPQSNGTSVQVSAEGSTFEADYTFEGAPGSASCTTDVVASGSDHTCIIDLPSDPNDQSASAEDITVTQTGSPAWLEADPNVVSVPPSIYGYGATFSPTVIDPTATPVSATAPAGQTTDINALSGVDAHGLPESITGFDQGSHGSVALVPADGPVPAQLSYTPAPGFAGTDSFGYDVTTPLGISHNTVDVTVVAPLRIAPITVSTPAGKSVTIIVHAAAAPTTTTTTLRAAAPVAAADFVVFVDTPPAHGTVTSHGHQLTYTPAAGFHGTDRLVYGVDDRGARSTAALTVTVLAPAAPTPAPTTPPAAPPTSPPVHAAAATTSGPLASTGAATGELLLVGVGLLASGAVVTVTSRRRAGVRR